MPDDRPWTDAVHRYLDGDGSPPPDASARDRADAFASAVHDWASALPPVDPSLDARVMDVVRRRSSVRSAWWRWFVEPRRVALRPAFAAAAALALMALSSVITLTLRERAPAAEGAGITVPATATGTVLVRFELVAPDARHVALAGSFNEWSDSTIVFARSAETGAWAVTVALPPGRYQYLFVVDGERWMPDPAAHAQVEDEFGQQNSLLVVGPRGVVRS